MSCHQMSVMVLFVLAAVPESLSEQGVGEQSLSEKRVDCYYCSGSGGGCSDPFDSRGPSINTYTDCAQCYKIKARYNDIEREFKTELEEAPYIARLRSVLKFSFCLPQRATQILDHLYLGSESEATNPKLLKQLGITHIVNCASDYCHTGPSFYGHKMKYLEFDAQDDHDYNVLQHFPQTYAFVEDARKTGGKALVHCLAGINRSGALVVAYTMVHQHTGPISTALQIRQQRGNLLSNDGFQRQLVAFARERGLLHLDADKLVDGKH